MYAQTHDYSAFVVFVEIPFGFESRDVAVVNQSGSATLEMSLDGNALASEVEPGADWRTNLALSSIWLRRKLLTGELLVAHAAFVEALDLAIPPPPPEPEPEPPPPEPPPGPDPLLELLREEKFATIDMRTRSLIARGFLHAGLTFSLSERAQVYFTNMYIARLMLGYPLTVNTSDDSGSHDIASAAEVEVMYAIAVGTVKAHLGSGTVLKSLTRAAASIADLNAIVDARGV